ncbi:MAG TPA: DUF3306 domain-containing protein [Burkholderiales bacterium]|nr:DUF3306 domain-containing protein [Burkholderiales bacterium]
MSDDRQRNGEKFLDRWSRLKQQARTQPPSPAAGKRNEPVPAPPLPSLESLTFDSDFSPFMHPEVDDGLRRMALKKLFSDPHFNRIDGLDVYIDDYTGADPIPPELLERLMKDHRKLFARDDQTPAEEMAAAADDSQAPHMADGVPADVAGLPPVVEPDAERAPHETASPQITDVLPRPDPDETLTVTKTQTGEKKNDTRSC